LDLPEDACVRWTSFNSKIDAYQGELVNKEAFTHAFVDQRSIADGYRYENIASVLDVVVATAIAMRQRDIAKVYTDRLEDRLAYF
jgi:hypothetical protein